MSTDKCPNWGAGEAIAHASGNEDAANEIKKNTAAAMQAIGVAQAVVTTATEAGTIATTIFGAAAQSAWAAATLGVSVLIAGIVALTGNIKTVTDAIKNLFSSKETSICEYTKDFQYSFLY